MAAQLSNPPTTNYVALHGAALFEAGFKIIPIAPREKFPGQYNAHEGTWKPLRDWETYGDRLVPMHVKSWCSWLGAGIGVLCGEVVAVDIDLTEEPLASQVRERIVERLGPTPAMRVGQAPKSLLVYRCSDPRMRKIARHPVEVLACGQQFVAYGVHPSGIEYSWPVMQLADLTVASLPLVTPEQLAAAVDYAMEIVPQEMRRMRLAAGLDTLEDAAPSDDGLLGTPEACAAITPYLPNGNLNWDDWNRIGMALWAAAGGAEWGRTLFHSFSMQSAKYDRAETDRRWDHFRRSPPQRIGMGSLVEIASANGFDPGSSAVAFNPAKAEAARLAADPDGPLRSALAAFERMPRSGHTSTTPIVAPAPVPAVLSTPPAPAPWQPTVEFPSEWLSSGSLVGDIATWIACSGRRMHITFALGAALALMGAITGRKYAAVGMNTRPNLLAIGVAGPGSGKEHARQSVKEILRAAGLHERYLGGDEFASGPSVASMMERWPSRICMVDEFGLYLEAIYARNASPHRREIASMMMRMYTSSGGLFNGAEYAGKERQDIESPNLNIWGTSTPSSLARSMNRAMVESGMLSRLLLVPPLHGDDYPARVEPSMPPAPPADAVRRLKEVADYTAPGAGNLSTVNVVGVTIKPVPVMLEATAQAMIREMGDYEDAQARRGQYQAVRATETTIKLAMLEAISLDHVSPVITLPIMQMAHRLVRYCHSYTDRLLTEHVAENETEQNVKRVQRIIAEMPAGASKSDITRRTQNLKPRERDDILKQLIESGVVTTAVDRHDGGRGRPTTRYLLVA